MTKSKWTCIMILESTAERMLKSLQETMTSSLEPVSIVILIEPKSWRRLDNSKEMINMQVSRSMNGKPLKLANKKKTVLNANANTTKGNRRSRSVKGKLIKTSAWFRKK